MKNFIQAGEVVEAIAPYDVASGDGVLLGTLFGYATHAALSGKPVNIKTRGVFEGKKTSAQAWATVGLAIYWDNTAKELTTTVSTNALVGKNLAAAANPSATGIVRLNG